MRVLLEEAGIPGMTGKRKQVVRKKKRSGPSLALVLLWLLLAIAATPAFFLLGYLYNRIRMAIQQFRLKNHQYDFWLTPKQCMAYLKNTNRHNEIKKTISSAKGDSKKDVEREYRLELATLTKELATLERLPLYKWKRFRERVARTNAFLLSFFSWCGVALYFHFPPGSQTISTIIDECTRVVHYVPRLISVSGNPQPLGADLMWIGYAAVLPVLLYFPFKQLAGFLVGFYSKKPDEVSFGSVSSSLDSGQIKAAFVAIASKNLEPIVEDLDAATVASHMARGRRSTDPA